MKDTPMNFGRVWKGNDKFVRAEWVPMNFEPLEELTLDALMNGQPFFYNGHFSRLRDRDITQHGVSEHEPVELRLNPETCDIQTTAGEHWVFKLATSDQMIIFHPAYGNIFVKLKECQIKL